MSELSEEANVEKKEETIPNNVKKEHSYTYWVDEKNKARELPEQHKPKKIEAPTNTSYKPGSGPSNWNSSGTWQERTIHTNQLEATVSKAINQWLSDKECQLALTSVSLEGELKQIFTNNKRKLLFQITGKVNFEGEELYLKLQDVTCSGDRDYRVCGKNKEEKAKLQSVGQKLMVVVLQALNSYKQ